MPEVTTGLTFRELPSGEWYRLIEFEPYDKGLPPDDGHWRIFVAEIDGAIVGFTSLHTQVHWDPWFVDPTHQGNPGVVRGLISQGAEVLTQIGIDHVFCTIPDEHYLSQRLATRLGFIEAPGKLYLLTVGELKEF